MSDSIVPRNQFLEEFRNYFDAYKSTREIFRGLPPMENPCQDYVRQYVTGVDRLYVEARIHEDMQQADIAIYAPKDVASLFYQYCQTRGIDILSSLGIVGGEKLHCTPSNKECHAHLPMIDIDPEHDHWARNCELIAKGFVKLIGVLRNYNSWLQ